tara:strand:- start:437 stop:856 length:420 start_codon:yes stop_codon:yes gene_type:complete
MKNNTFDYKHTCPDIDKEIRNFQTYLSNRLDEIIEELSPMFADTNKKVDYRNNWESIIYDDSEPCFEGVRKTNEDMRAAAEYQIESLTDSLSEAEYTANHWEAEAGDMTSMVSELRVELQDREEYIEELKQKIRNYENI